MATIIRASHSEGGLMLIEKISDIYEMLELFSHLFHH